MWVRFPLPAPLIHRTYGRAFPGLAGTYFALVVGVLAASVMELSTFIAMRDLSELFVGAGAEAGTRFETASAVIRGLRNGMHFTGKVLGGASVMAFFLLLFRARLVPRWMSAFGALAALLQMASVARPLFGGEVIYAMLAPLGIAYVSMLTWLLIKGFAPGTDRVADVAHGA